MRVMRGKYKNSIFLNVKEPISKYGMDTYIIRFDLELLLGLPLELLLLLWLPLELLLLLPLELLLLLWLPLELLLLLSLKPINQLESSWGKH